MKHKVIRLFLDFQKEEQWINEMSAKGLQLISCSFPQYLFEEGQPGEYIYRLELLEKSPQSAEGKAYIRFVEESGIECVDTWWQWAYFRRKTSDGPFDVYTDTTAKIKHYERIATIEGFGASVNAALCAYNVIVLHIYSPLLLPGALVAILLTRVTWSHLRIIRNLKKELKLRE